MTLGHTSVRKCAPRSSFLSEISFYLFLCSLSRRKVSAIESAIAPPIVQAVLMRRRILIRSAREAYGRSISIPYSRVCLGALALIFEALTLTGAFSQPKE